MSPNNQGVAGRSISRGRLRLTVALLGVLGAGVFLSITYDLRPTPAPDSTALLLAGQVLNGFYQGQPLAFGFLAAYWRRPLVFRFVAGLLATALFAMLIGLPNASYYYASQSAPWYTLWFSMLSCWRWMRPAELTAADRNPSTPRTTILMLLLLTAGVSLVLAVSTLASTHGREPAANLSFGYWVNLARGLVTRL